MIKEYNDQLPRSWDVFQPGDRVITTGAILSFPLRELPAGQTGTVLRSTDDLGIVVRMDAHHPDLDEWDNEAHVGLDLSCNDPEVFTVPLRRMTENDKASWTNPYMPSTGIDLEVVSDRITDHMINVGNQAQKISAMALHFKALGLTGPYDQLYLIAAALDDVADEINTTRLGHLGERVEND